MALLFCLAAASCGNRAAQAPNPPGYDWPDHLAYRMDFVSEAQRDRQPLLKFAESKTIRLDRREGQYLGVYDSVLKTSQSPGEPLRIIPYKIEDTLAFYMRVGTQGELSDVALGCDPAVPACRDALPSSVLFELRRLIPRLSLWEAPQGTGWVDTLQFDDAARHGARGTLITTYGGRRDTTLNGRSYWVVSWHSIRRAFDPARVATPTLGAAPVVEETGITLVDKLRLLPVFSEWAGGAAAPPDLQAAGATAIGFRGRAWLSGTIFDSLFAHQMEP